jgi:hypothetical protein
VQRAVILFLIVRGIKHSQNCQHSKDNIVLHKGRCTNGWHGSIRAEQAPCIQTARGPKKQIYGKPRRLSRKMTVHLFFCTFCRIQTEEKINCPHPSNSPRTCGNGNTKRNIPGIAYFLMACTKL